MPAKEIHVVSFTRASSSDLRHRVHSHCQRNGRINATDVAVTTLLSLALKALRSANLLAYPVDPVIMDQWKQENVFDAEFGARVRKSPSRCEEIRRDHEAFWSTNRFNPPNYLPPTPPITSGEQSGFSTYQGPRTQTYAAVLPGQIIRECVRHARAGTLSLSSVLGLNHLVVDEYQDFNPMDIEFVDLIAASGVKLLVAGDDDQSVYSFRFASPSGIQNFPAKYPQAGLHTLSDCFRCTPDVLSAGSSVLNAFSPPGRIPKGLASLHVGANPPLNGIVHRWRLNSGPAESRAVAQSCADLIAAGVSADDIIILLSDSKLLGGPTVSALAAASVPSTGPGFSRYPDTQGGRFCYELIRIICDPNDYFAHRVLLGLPTGVGPTTCLQVTDVVINNNLNYQSIFYVPPSQGILNKRGLAALTRAQNTCLAINGWQATDQIQTRQSDLANLIASEINQTEAQAWLQLAATLPAGMTLEELKELWRADSEEEEAVMSRVYSRLDLSGVVSTQPVASRVRVMTMHKAKGLSAKVVFIPGLEEEVLPGPWRRPYQGLVLEAARLLYVLITRVRAACVISYAGGRTVYGSWNYHTPSRFASYLNGSFSARTGSLSAPETVAISAECSHL